MIDWFIYWPVPHSHSLNFVPFSFPILRHFLNIAVNEKQMGKIRIFNIAH